LASADRHGSVIAYVVSAGLGDGVIVQALLWSTGLYYPKTTPFVIKQASSQMELSLDIIVQWTMVSTITDDNEVPRAGEGTYQLFAIDES